MALLAWLLGTVSAARAHPVPQGSHDRTLTIRLTQQAVIVEYRLEVDPWTIVFQDLPAVAQQAELGKLSEPAEFYATFTRLYAPRLAAGLKATLDSKPLVFVPQQQRHEVLDHIRCEFVLRTAWQPDAAAAHRFDFHDSNFQGQPGQVKVSLAAAAGVQLRAVAPPPGMISEEVRSSVRTGFTLVDPSQAPASEPEQAGGEASQRPLGEDSGLLRLFLDSRRAFWWLLVMAAALGAAHALTPGHGKALVAAYLVGERGTVWHAIFLGLVVTLTHTGGVLLLAGVLRVMYPNGISAAERGDIVRTLELGGGILIVGLGFWLLLRRLSGKADHIHLGSSGHHHHHHPHHHHDHHHPHAHDHDHAPSHSHPIQGGWWGLVALGIGGGIVPCWDAVALLVAAVFMNMVQWALPLLLAFSAGLAAVLVVIGILVVRTKALAGRRWENSRLFRALPLISAVLVSLLGLWLCLKAVRGG